MVGDVVGRPGRKVILNDLANIKKECNADFVIANLENASAGKGVTEQNLKQLLTAPIDVVTMGNHTFHQKETVNYISKYPMMLRPLNYPSEVPGKAFTVKEHKGTRIGVLNISGQAYMPDMDSPFQLTDNVIDQLNKECDILIIDFHGEATGEKQAYANCYDGRASAIVGTHTHVQTADNRVLPNGTAYITDVGMTGPQDSVIGTEKEIIIKKLRTKIPQRYRVELKYPYQFNGVLIDIDEKTGKAREIKRIFKEYENTVLEGKYKTD